MKRLWIGCLSLALLAACSEGNNEVAEVAEPAAPAETAEAFVARVNEELRELGRETGAAAWVRATYITEDTAILSSLARERYAKWHGETVEQAMAYDDMELAPETRRAIDLLKLGTSLPTPKDPVKRRELTEIATEMTGMYGAGKYCRSENDCISGTELELLMQEVRDYDELLDLWQGWRKIAPPMRDKYRRFVELGNAGARGLGFDDLARAVRLGSLDLSGGTLRTPGGDVIPGLEGLVRWETYPAVLDTFFAVTERPAGAGEPKAAVRYFRHHDGPLHNGFVYFYSVTATDHVASPDGRFVVAQGDGALPSGSAPRLP